MTTESIQLLTTALTAKASAKKSVDLARFFKTAKGEYGEGDVFMGVTVPEVRAVAKQYMHSVTLTDIEILLQSPYHEIRLCALEILKWMYKLHTEQQISIAEFYLQHLQGVNNWDLVDLSCSYILGHYLYHHQQADYQLLLDFTDNANMWIRRIAVISTLYFVQQQKLLTPSLNVITRLLQDPEELLAKANGWVLREVGKKDLNLLRKFLLQHLAQLKRTTLRYAIERMESQERLAFLHNDLNYLQTLGTQLQ